MKLPSLLLKIDKQIEKYLDSRYQLDSRATISKIKEKKLISGPYEEIKYKFKLIVYVRNKFDLLNKKEILANAIKSAISRFDKFITRVGVHYLEGEQIGEYSTIDYSIDVEFLREIKKSLGKYKFISREKNKDVDLQKM